MDKLFDGLWEIAKAFGRWPSFFINAWHMRGGMFDWREVMLASVAITFFAFIFWMFTA